MTNLIKIVIKGRPYSVNKTYRTVRGNRTLYLDHRAKSYADSVRWQAKAQWRKNPLKRDLEVSYFYYFNNYQRRDHLNFNKLLNDHLNQIVWEDDRQIKISHHYTKIDKANPRIEIYIKYARENF